MSLKKQFESGQGVRISMGSDPFPSTSHERTGIVQPGKETVVAGYPIHRDIRGLPGKIVQPLAGSRMIVEVLCDNKPAHFLVPESICEDPEIS